MRCQYCNRIIPDGTIMCPFCKRPMQIVPDYNPLDDVLAAEIKGAMNETYPDSRRTSERRSSYSSYNGRNGQTGRQGVRTGTESKGTPGSRVQSVKGKPVKSGKVVKANQSTKAGQSGRKNTGQLTPAQKRSQMILRRRKAKIRRLKRMMLTGVITIVLVVGLLSLLTANSYSGLVKKGDTFFEENNYGDAAEMFTKALDKDKSRGEAYAGLAKVYIAQGTTNKADEMFDKALKEQPQNEKIYREAILYYIASGQETKVSPLLNSCKYDNILLALSEYMSPKPEFSLDETVTYDEIQTLELTSDGEKIYYTLDNTTPLQNSSTEYTQPIILEEGDTVVQAISVNAAGISSPVVKKIYSITYPMADAPAVTPSTGQYEGAKEIEVIVPNGYQAYYTTDGSDPTAESILYTGPVKMPMGNTIFSVVLVDENGRPGDVTIRNYERIE